MLVTSVVGGLGPTLLSLALSLPIGSAEFVLRAGYPVSQAAAQACLYAFDGFMIVYMTFLMRRRREGLQEANRKLQLANEAREHSLMLVRETIELAPDAYLLTDSEAVCIEANRAACRLLEVVSESSIGDFLPYFAAVTSDVIEMR